MNEEERRKIEYEYATRNEHLGPLKIYKKMDHIPNNANISSVEGINAMARRLYIQGGPTQQQRMVRDKQKSLAKALLYSYQGAFIKKHEFNDRETQDIDRYPIRALINPNKLKPDYDDKILSVPYDYDFQPGDVFEWMGTGTFWIILLQDLEELAYFRGDIRKCSYEICWMDDDGTEYFTYAAVRGPVETKIDYIQKHTISVERPNYSLHFYIPKNEHTLKYFRRYAKFYLSDGYENTCWRIEATDAYSMPGVLELNAVEYYANEDKDEDGIVNAKIIAKKIEQKTLVDESAVAILGDGFIKPKRIYTYTLTDAIDGEWFVDKRYPVKTHTYLNHKGLNTIELTWTGSYSGQFSLVFDAVDGRKYTQVIVVESLF